MLMILTVESMLQELMPSNYIHIISWSLDCCYDPSWE